MVNDTQGVASKGGVSIRRNLIFPLVLFGGTVICGTIGTYQYLMSLPTYQALPTREVFLEALFTSLGFLVLNSGPYPATNNPTPLLVYIGRGTGVFFFSYAAILGFGALFAERLKPLRISQWNLQSQLGLDNSGGHVIVCGLGHKGFELANTLLKTGHNVVAIEQDSESSRAAELSDNGAIVLQGNATRRHTLGLRAKAHAASEVFVNCGNDRTNTRVIQTLASWLEERSDSKSLSNGHVACQAHIEDRRRRYLIHEQLHDHPGLRLHTYDTANATARELLHRRPVGRFETNPLVGRTHVVLVGWSNLALALVFELCQTMHYLEEHNRQITVICREPEQARNELYDRHPSLNPNHWNRKSVQTFVRDLFPDISFLNLPVNEDVLLSDQFGLYDQLRPYDTLTIIATGADEYQSGSPVATMLPRLEAINGEMELDTQVHYFAPASDDQRNQRNSPRFTIDSDEIKICEFGEFVDNCTPKTVRGEHRDQVAKQMALFFHLRYDYDPTAEKPAAVDQALAENLSLNPPTDRGYTFEKVTDLWNQHSVDQLMMLAEIVWKHLSEADRDANRHAADHVPIKHHLKASLAGQTNKEDIIDRLVVTEHRRWCAEKFLDGWKPLSEENASQWRVDGEDQEQFRAQKYHLDLRPFDELKQITEAEAEKDVSLVRFVLEHIQIESWNWEQVTENGDDSH